MKKMEYRLVDFIPDELEENILYVSMEFSTATHKCACGCGNEVVTPISPTDWSISFDNDLVSLHPSIGNWSFECRSHYWVINGVIEWSTQWSELEIEEGRLNDRANKQEFYGNEVTLDDECIEGETDFSLWNIIIGSLKKFWNFLTR